MNIYIKPVVRLGLLSLYLSGCTPANHVPENNTGSDKLTPYPKYNGDTLPINETSWQQLGYSDYPFLTYGDLACVNNEVYFYPADSFNETAIGTPLNQQAANALATMQLKPTEKNAIKPGANLSQAIKVGLDICQYVERQFNEKQHHGVRANSS